ncbi:MAG: hypothetical protein E7107_02605 [Prevotella sp.]|nr:hypothetical protein [Prevotella sp.]
MIQFNKLLLFVCLAFAFAIPCKGQNKEYEKEKKVITDVKRNPSKYVYAEATCKTEEEAKAVAEEMFIENINEYVHSVKKLKDAGDIVLNDQKGLRQVITMPRGTNMHRVFLYVKKSDIVAMKNPVVLTNAETSSNIPASTVTPVESSSKKQEYIPQAIQEIATMETVQQLNQALKTMKQNGRIVAYDKYNNLAAKSEWYLVIYDANGIIKAVLTDGKERTNIITKVADSERNYPGHAAIGIKVAK